VTDWQYARTMTPEQYDTALAVLGLSQLAAGRWLGVSARTSRRYHTGDAKIPPAHALLIRAAIHHKWRLVVPAWRKGES
jgi:DNA-binding transcriptional regulator YdaS (Cro superfamily)